TGRTDFFFGETIATRAMPQALDRICQGAAKLVGARQIVLQKVVGHAASRTHTDTGQTAQRINKRLERLRLGKQLVHQKGSFIPGGKGMPAVTADIFSCEVASALRSASLNAAATRS